MNVQKYLEENSIEKLQQELFIVVTDYPDRVVLNYNQIESPRFDPICDECRALILRKGTWEVMARSFQRFYNVGEDPNTKNFLVSQARIEQKIDGSLMSVYWDGTTWCVSTRKKAFAEGTTVFGRRFADVFQEAASKTSLWTFLDENTVYQRFTWVFELVSPETRVVTPYPEPHISLITVRDNVTGNELTGRELDNYAKLMHVDRPLSYKFTTLEETIEAANKLAAMDEGFVLVEETPGLPHWRLKCKNGKHLAIAHMRENGNISPKRILKLVMENEVEEYLSYFECDKPYFDLVQEKWNDSVKRIEGLFAQYNPLESQKEFALSIIPKTVYDFEKGVLFEMRKGKPMQAIFKAMGETAPRKLADSMSLKEAIAKKFKVVIDEET